MRIEIIGAESLGVRGLCCFIEASNRRILIDPGVALGYVRHGLLPHPVQVAVGVLVRRLIIERWAEATDVVISHFHGDHTPLYNANPYQLSVWSLVGLNRRVRVWAKGPEHLVGVERERARALSTILGLEVTPAEGREEGLLAFSKPVPHGVKGSRETVIMTRVSDGREVFVHAPDVQLLNEEAVKVVEAWQPRIALVGGPPLYRHLHEKLRLRAWRNAVRLSQEVDVLILDHHMMRCEEGVEWLERLSSITGNRVLCAADYMRRPRMLLEAWRRQLYQAIPVPRGWHDAYARGEVGVDEYVEAVKALMGRGAVSVALLAKACQHALNRLGDSPRR